MELYNTVAKELSHHLTVRYSTSFSSASKLYAANIRPHIFAIYGWVRVADEIVDTYRGKDAGDRLDDFRSDTYHAIKTGFSTNPIIQAFADTCTRYRIDKPLIEPFITSMRYDLKPPKNYTKQLYEDYIYGSAQVVGLMCLKVFTGGDTKQYESLRMGAESLGAAFQKVNFLRDFASDTNVLHRHYFPGVRGNILSEADKQAIIKDIKHDFTHSLPALAELPDNCRTAVTAATKYYYALLKKLEATPAAIISKERVRVPDWKKAEILARVKTKHTLQRRVF
jgi:phytoene/squalene synthetase